MRFKDWSGPYAIGYVITSLGLNTFYKKYQSVNIDNVPLDESVILASNHQNAFLDPILIAVLLDKPIYYLTRADIFKKPLANKLFTSFNMIPIYRERDGVDTKNANEETFNRCHTLLSEHKPVTIFPEGNHGKLKSLRPTKKGVFRIANGAIQKYGDYVYILPIGLNYSDHNNMGAEYLIIFGDKIKVNDYLSKDPTPVEINNLKEKYDEEVDKLMINIQCTDYYHFIHEIMFLFNEENRIYYKHTENTLYDNFKADKKFISDAEDWLEHNQDPALEEQMIEFKSEVEEMGLRYWLFRKPKHSVFWDILGLIVLFPVHLYGMINHYLPYKIPVWFVKKNIKDKQFHASLKMAMGVILFIVFWLLQTAIVGLVTDNKIWLYYLITLPVTAWISYEYWIHFLKTKGKLRYNQLSNAKTEKFTKLKEQYEKWSKIRLAILKKDSIQDEV